MREIYYPLPCGVGQRPAVDEDATKLVDARVACNRWKR